MRAGKLMIAAGCCLLAAALCLTGYNLWDNARAGKKAEETLLLLSRLSDKIPGRSEPYPQTVSAQTEALPDETGTEETAMTTEAVIPVGPAPETEKAVPKETEAVYPDYLLNPDLEMPTVTLDGVRYIGVIEIPTLGIRLPVIESWNDDLLRIAPCRFAGSAYRSDFVIAGHNYVSHLGPIHRLRLGDPVCFTDMDGNLFVYEVIEVETLGPFENTRMKTGDWDLTVFTCTLGGKTRVTVRCALTEEHPML